MAWHLVFTRRAERDLADLPAAAREAVRQALQRMTADLSSADITKLGGAGHRWRLRVGQLRVILELDNREGLIIAARVLPRGRAYRR